MILAGPPPHAGEHRIHDGQVRMRRVISAQATRRSRLGFRDGERGTHASRTMMLAELRILLDACPATATWDAYRAAIVEENVLGRRTGEARRVTAQKLHELYGLDPSFPVFRGLRRAWTGDPDARPIMAFLCAFARDPLLRSSAPTVLSLAQGEHVSSPRFASDLRAAIGERFSSKTLLECGRRLASSWSQAGYLSGTATKTRTKPVVSPAAAAYAMLLGHLEGYRGQRLFATIWAQLLDRPEHEIRGLLIAASQRGLIDFRAVGDVVEVRFGDWLTRTEQEMAREPS